MIEAKISQETKTKAVLKGFTKEDQEEIDYYSKVDPMFRYTEDDKPHKISLEITQALLAQWLREKHNIMVDTSWGQNSLGLVYYYYDISIIGEEKRSYPVSSERFITYQEAMEDGLKAALDLIP